MSDVPDSAAYEVGPTDKGGMPENFPGQVPEAPTQSLDAETEAFANELDSAAEPEDALHAGAGGDTTLEQAGVNYSPNLETPLSDAEIHNAAANGNKDLDCLLYTSRCV